MIRKIMMSFLVLLLGLISIGPVKAENNIALFGEEAVILDIETGEVLYGKNEEKQMYPASITKVLTVITALQFIDNIDSQVTITKSDLETIYETGASAAYFTEGEVVTYRDLILGALIPSGADACRALARNTKGSQKAFVKEMNKLAKKVGAKSSNFENTTGIHGKNHYTTVKDMALILQYAMKNKNFADLFQLNKATSSDGLHTWFKKVYYNAKNAGIDVSGLVGTKSGFTDEAGSTLASVVTVNGRLYAAVIGKTDNKLVPNACMRDTNTLAQYVKDNYSLQQVIKKGEKLSTINIKKGKEATIDIYATKTVTALLPNNFNKDDLKVKVDQLKKEAPIAIGDKIAKVTVSYKGRSLYTADITSTKAVALDTISVIVDILKSLFFPYGVGAILVVIFFILRGKRKPTKKRK